MALPVPNHREPSDDICIELLYQDEDIKRTDELGRCLYLSNEFNHVSGRHISEDLNYKYVPKLKSDKLRIIDSDVYNDRNQNVALPKVQFAQHILDGDAGFTGINFDGFRGVFEQVNKVLIE